MRPTGTFSELRSEGRNSRQNSISRNSSKDGNTRPKSVNRGSPEKNPDQDRKS